MPELNEKDHLDYDINKFMDVQEVRGHVEKPAYPRIKVGTSRRVVKTFIYDKELGKVVDIKEELK